MPYITQDRRQDLTMEGRPARNRPQDAGELNYLITEIIVDYIQRKGKRYQFCNDVLGALDGAGKEFYRRLVAPYEDVKIIDNGDCYPQL